MKLFFTTALAFTLTAFAGCAEAGTISSTDKADIENIVRSYLLENPEIIREALLELEKKQDRALLAEVEDDLKNDNRDITYGPANAKVTIVEFFDYNCGYCKRSTDWLKTVMETHPNDVRVVFKELPILDGKTKTSRSAAKAALAAGRQGKYKEMHFALMAERSLSSERIDALAKKNGVNVEKMREDMQDSKLEKHLEDTLLLASRIPPLTGTPFFVINDAYMPGANTQALQQLLEDALKS